MMRESVLVLYDAGGVLRHLIQERLQFAAPPQREATCNQIVNYSDGTLLRSSHPLGRDASVEGEIRQVEAMIPLADGAETNWIWYAILVAPGIILALFLLGAVLQLLLPGLLSRAAYTATERPWASLGLGVILAFLTPAVVALLFATVIGIPIALVIMASYFMLLVLAFVAISYCIGLYVRGLVATKEGAPGLGSRILWSVTGILVLVIVGLIPFVGWAVGMLALITGLGAVMSLLWQMLRGSGLVQQAPV